MGYFDLMFFVIEYAKKHGHEATCAVMKQFVRTHDKPRSYNVPEDNALALAEELVRRY